MITRTATAFFLALTLGVQLGFSADEKPKKFPNITCELHGVEFEHFEVPIHYGLGSPEASKGLSTEDYEQYKSDRAVSFPYSSLHKNGGCIIAEDDPQSGPVVACPVCMKNEREWWDNFRRRRQAEHEKKIQAMSEQEFQRMINSIERMMQDPRILEDDEQLEFLEEQLILLKRIRSGDGIPPTPVQEE